jgi:hypothetical protein
MSSKSIRFASLQVDGDARESRRERWARMVTLAFSHARARVRIICLGLLLVTSYLGVGAVADDDFHSVALQSEPTVAGTKRAPWDLFSFATVEHNPALMESGVFPWWTDPELVISFFRPLSSLTTWLDEQIWQRNDEAKHLQSLLWYALLLAALSATFGKLSLSPKHAALALLLFAVDDARFMPVGWLAQRNALVAMGPAVLALYLHHRGREEGAAWQRALAPLCLAIGLLGGESALSICGYLLAYALVMDRRTLRARFVSLLPYGAVVIAWRVLYTYLERGALHSGLYVDPGREPLEFARLLFVRLPILLLGQLGLPYADMWEVYPMMSPWLRPVVWLFAMCVIGLGFYLLRPLLREHRLLRFWALGSLLATIPMCGVHPEDRMLTATAFGATQLVASFLWALLDGSYARATRLSYVSAGALVLVHLVFAPVTLPLRAYDIYAIERMMLHADKSLPQGDEVKGKTLVIVNPPLDIFAVYWPLMRGAQHWTLPEHFRWLATGEADLQVTRVDAQSLTIAPEGGFLTSGTQAMFRRPDRKFTLNHEIRLQGVTYKVIALTHDGRPAQILARFDRPLEDPQFAWRMWGKYEYQPFTPPAVGKSVLLPKADMGALLDDPRNAS